MKPKSQGETMQKSKEEIAAEFLNVVNNAHAFLYREWQHSLSDMDAEWPDLAPDQCVQYSHSQVYEVFKEYNPNIAKAYKKMLKAQYDLIALLREELDNDAKAAHHIGAPKLGFDIK